MSFHLTGIVPLLLLILCKVHESVQNILQKQNPGDFFFYTELLWQLIGDGEEAVPILQAWRILPKREPWERLSLPVADDRRSLLKAIAGSCVCLVCGWV